MAPPLKVLFLLEDLCFGGTQRQMLELARRMDRSRFSPSILTLTGPTDLDPQVLAAGIPLYHLGTERKLAPLFFWRLRAALRRAAPDILVPCTALPNIWGRIWGRIIGLPVVVGTCRGGGGPVRQHERWLWSLTHHLICNSQALHEVLQGLGIPAGHLTYIPNGVDTEFFCPTGEPCSDRAPLLLCVGRLAKDKDHLTLLHAFAQILKQQPNVRLRLVGNGPEEVRLRLWADNHPAGSRVEFVPGEVDMRPHYAAASLFVLASQREGQPNVILEAMSSALPVCATSVGGVPHLVADGQSGLLCPAGDATAFAANCLSLLTDTTRAHRMGQTGRRIVEQEFSFHAMVEAHQDLFTRIWLSNKGQQ